MADSLLRTLIAIYQSDCPHGAFIKGLLTGVLVTGLLLADAIYHFTMIFRVVAK